MPLQLLRGCLASKLTDRSFMQETMRLYPVISSGTLRTAQRDFELGGQLIPAGVTVITPFQAAFTHPQLFEDPDSFKPVRPICCASV